MRTIVKKNIISIIVLGACVVSMQYLIGVHDYSARRIMRLSGGELCGTPTVAPGLFETEKTTRVVADQAPYLSLVESGTGSPDTSGPVKKTGRLTSSLYESMLGKGNFVFSPYSLLDCMRILYPAADGKSKEEFETILGLDRDRANVLESTDRENILQNGTGIRTANKAFINSGIFETWNDSGIFEAKDFHPEVLDADDVDIVPFRDDIYVEINEYVSEQTEGKIQDLLSPENANRLTAAVLVNAIYYKNLWNHEERTILWEGSDAYEAFGNDVQTAQIKEFNGIDVLRLPYLNRTGSADASGRPSVEIPGMHQYAMYIIADSEDSASRGVDRFIAGMSEEEIYKVLDFSAYKGLPGYTSAHFTVPVFEMDSKASFKDMLQEQGMTACFSPGTADFRRFAPVCISDVIQAAWIRADSGGTEAAAATAVVMKELSAVPMNGKIKRVVADHTFAFFLKDDTADEILFVGRVENLSKCGVPGRGNTSESK